MVKTTGIGFRLYCQTYRKQRKARDLKPLGRKEFVLKAAKCWQTLDSRVRKRYYAKASRQQSAQTSAKKRSQRTPSKRKGANGGRSRASANRIRAIYSAYRRHPQPRVNNFRGHGRQVSTPSRSRSLVGSITGRSDTSDRTGYDSMYTGRDGTTATSQTSYTSLTSCTTGGLSYVTTDTSREEEFYDSRTFSDQDSEDESPPPQRKRARKVQQPKQNAGTKQTPTVSNRKKPAVVPAAATAPKAKAKRTTKLVEKTAAFSRPRRNLPKQSTGEGATTTA